MKKKRHTNTPKTAILFVPLLLLTFLGIMLMGGAVRGEFSPFIPPPDLNPLNQTVVPEPPQLAQFVKDKPAAIRLGKAFFWDMQVGSDGIQACASCHFSAGVDKRLKNTLNPGPGDTIFGNNFSGVPGLPQFGPNYTLQPADFPFHQRQAPTDLQTSTVLRDTNDVVGSQGVRLTEFVDIIPGSAVDSMTSTADPVFNVGGSNTRRVTGRNTPTNINAIFNFTNFWDGRANFIFNGQNPFGPADPNAGVWFSEAGQGLEKKPVAIQFASLASQATGPALDHTEMSARGRSFPKLGQKMLSLTPLGKQLVHPGDSVLGSLSRAVQQPNGTITGANGLNTTYSQMIQDTFKSDLWDSSQLTPDGFTQMEANFALFWGLAIQLYEATLVSDQTPFDRWLAGDPTALTDQQKFGFALFSGIGNCVACHGGIEFTNASSASIAFVNNFDNETIELMFVADGTQVLYDNGFNNTGVTPTTADIGRGGNTPFTNLLTGQPVPLSFSRLAVLQAQNLLPFETPILEPFIPINMTDNSNGLFKVPGLRNVELTAPYFHNGSVMTLEGVVDLYVRGGNFAAANIADLDPILGEGLSLLQGNETMQAAMVAFLKSLTDERVRNESAPFDHPELFIPEGDPEVLTRIAARDFNGQAALPSELTINPVTALTSQTSQLISGTKEVGATVQVKVNNGLASPADTPTATTWSTTLTGLVEGNNTITVTFTDLLGTATAITTAITVDTTPPALTLNAVTTPTNATVQTVSGTVEAGRTPVVTVSTTATVGPVSVTGTGWSAQISGLTAGVNTITVNVTDPAGNGASAIAAVTLLSADGNLDGGVVTTSDALTALRLAVGLGTPTVDNLMHGDVAPFVNSAPAPDGVIDVGDALLILRKAVGLASF